ncbi:hypothetical protein DSO57_1006492 [Entomophthora muscae]|uniref:Uncharacterized protein n=1 Tax=Entomophthora muscae TaxID=34485 RepID=A0ACC2RMC5_9FUNG|nr:hypothetical protein DSO57_1006492 [Entomophthora muscae]
MPYIFPLLENDNPFQLVSGYDPVNTLGTGGQEPHTPTPTPPPPILQPSAEVIPYDHSRYRMVILIILSLDEAVVPYLGAYCPLAAGMLYLSCSLPFLYWALVLQYPEGWTTTMTPWYGTTPGHDN